MIFEVWKNGKRMMVTEHEECIPDKQTIELMTKAGYEPRLNGKPYKGNRKKKIVKQ